MSLSVVDGLIAVNTWKLAKVEDTVGGKFFYVIFREDVKFKGTFMSTKAQNRLSDLWEDLILQGLI